MLDYIEQHDSDAFKQHDEKVRKEVHLEQAKKMLAKKRPIEEIIEFTGLTKEEIEAL